MKSREEQPCAGDARGVRVALFTDTLGDVNGVSRFLNDIADRSLACGRSLHIFTSTRMPIRDLPNLHNIRPRAAACLPGYRDLEIVLPALRRLSRAMRSFRPDVIHISTPGPIGLVGRLIASRHRIPLAGVYHTDFPAYVDHLFDDAALTRIARAAMRRFYRPFQLVFSRSTEYGAALAGLGIETHRRVRLHPGINNARFHPRFRDPGCWPNLGIPSTGVKVLYVGRVSIEKNLPLLTLIWKRLQTIAPDLDARLIVVGDGPYRSTMEADLESCNAHFLGFRHGEELSRLYASSDFFVFPSTTDTLGQVVLEAQASGLPALVTDTGGPKEVIRDDLVQEPTGFVLSPRDPAAWVRQIHRLCTHAPLRRSMGHAAHLNALNYAIQASFDHFWQCHERLAPQAQPAVRIEARPRAAESPSLQLDSVPS